VSITDSLSFDSAHYIPLTEGGITYSQCVSQKKNWEIFGVDLVCLLNRELIINLQLYILEVLDSINPSHSYCQNKPLLVRGTSCEISWIVFSFLFSVLFSLAHLSFVCVTNRITNKQIKMNKKKKLFGNKVFCDVMPYGLVARHLHFTGTCYIQLDGRRYTPLLRR
jgi:hypothetical protein